VKVCLRWPIALAAIWCVVGCGLARAADTVTSKEIRQNLFSTCFFNAQEGWIVGELGRIFRTVDGGATFLRTDTGTRSAFLSVACLPDRSVIAVGQYGLAMRSRDGGTSWQKLPTGANRNLLAVAFASDRVGVAVGDYGTIVRTEDGGNTWSKVSLPTDIPLPEDIAEIIEPGDVLLYDAQFVDDHTGWIVGEFGVILVTHDGGTTWMAQKSPVDTTLFGVNFPDVQHGWAVGIEGVMLRTEDGGATWVQQKVPGHKGFVLSLYDVAVRGSVGWAIGDSGLLLQSDDGGATWRLVDLPIRLAANWFRGISLSPDASGFIVGSEGLMLATHGTEYRELKPHS
jgi:photosystem II stability/assembly factor-like uncharacterized protein